MAWKRLAAALILTAGQFFTSAQRSGNQSICDYYATKRYGENNSTTQLLLVQSIVTLAYAGGQGLPQSTENNTGIFNEGTFDGLDVYLRPWFDGSKATTNLNNQPVGIDWLDGGGTEPLMAFLNGSVDSLELSNTTNQYRLFTHWFTAFGFVYGCSDAKQFPQTADAGAPLSISYVHKFMNLNSSDVGYFIEQLTIASQYFGFSPEDAQTLDTFMNAKYNVRCAPPVNGQLYSICLADECPLAQPSPDCDAYTNLSPTGSGGSSSSGPTPKSTAPPSSSTSSASSSPTTATSTTPSQTGGPSPVLSGGAIAGIAIGGAAVLLFAVGLWIFYRRQSSKSHIVPVPVPSAGYVSPSHGSHTYYSPNPHTSFPPGQHDSYMSGGGSPGIYPPKPQPRVHSGMVHVPTSTTPEVPIAEMESPYYGPGMEDAHIRQSHVSIGRDQYREGAI